MNLPKPKKRAAAYATKEFITIHTYSGLGRFAMDPAGKQLFFPTDASDEKLGDGVLQALSVSRFLSPDEIGAFFNLEVTNKNYEDWVELLIQEFGYKSRRALFKNMMRCSIERVDGVTTIRPSKHEKLEAWDGEGIESKDYEIIDETASDAEIGQALKRCFAKCI
jgi:hypothetical protein